MTNRESNETSNDAASDRSPDGLPEYLRWVEPDGVEIENVDDSDLLPLDDPMPGVDVTLAVSTRSGARRL